MKEKGFIPILIILILAGLAAGGYFVYTNFSTYKAKPTPSPSPNQVACTQEAKLCPDGSYVGREGPKCEFKPCPISESTSSADLSNWKIYTNNEYRYSIKYPESLQHEIKLGQGLQGGTVVADSWKPSDGKFTIEVESYFDGVNPPIELSQPTILSDTKIRFNSEEVRKVVGTGDKFSGAAYMIFIGPIKNKAQNYYIVYLSSQLKPDQTEITTYDQMFTTFKFTQ